MSLGFRVGASEWLPRRDTLFLLATLEPLINSRCHIASHDDRIASHDYRLEARATSALPPITDIGRRVQVSIWLLPAP